MTMSRKATSFFEDEGRLLLRALSRSTAYVDPFCLRNGQILVQRASVGDQAKAKPFSQSIWTKAVALNFVDKCEGDRLWRLTERGRIALRKALSGAGSSKASPELNSNPSKRPGVAKPQSRALPMVDDGESPLAWLAKRKTSAGVPLLRPSQFAAGERLREDF